MKIVELAQRSPEWKLWRKAGITATDSPVLMGVSPFKTPYRLWCEKVGRMNEPDLSVIPAVRFGIENEAKALKMFEWHTQDVVMPLCAEHDAYPIFRASFDGLNTAGEPVEIKCPSEETLNDVKVNGENSVAYRAYVWQVMHQIFVAEAAKGWLVFLDGDKLIVFCITRDESMIDQIKEKGIAFFEAVISQTEPEKDPLRDFFTPTSEEEIEQWVQNANAYSRIQTRIDELKQEMDTLKQSQDTFRQNLLNQMGQYDAADYAGIAITRSYVRGVVNLNKMLDLLNQKGHKPTDDEINACRGCAGERILVRCTDRLLPKDSVEAANDKALKAIETVSFGSSLIW